MTRLLAALVATIWGFNFVVIDWGMADVPPLLFVAIRFIAGAVPAMLLVPRPDAPWRTILAVGVFMSLGQFGFLYVAMRPACRRDSPPWCSRRRSSSRS